MKSMEKLDLLRRAAASGDPEQLAEAIVRTQEASDYVTKDFFEARLDARVNQLLTDITWRLIGLGVVVLAGVAALDKWVRP